MSVTSQLICIALCIFMSAFFSSSEMAFSSCNRVRLEHMRDNKNSSAGIAVKILDHFESALSAILVGNNLVNIAASSLGSIVAIRLAGDAYTWVSTLILTVLVIILGETVPKILAERNATSFSLVLARPVRVLMVILRPVTYVTVAFVNFITRLFPDEKEDGSDLAAEELRTIIETAENEDVLDEDTSELVSAAIDFSEVTVQEVMTARADMVVINVDDDPSEIYDGVMSAGVSRIPVYEGDIDHIIGVLHVNRYLKAAAGIASGEKDDGSGMSRIAGLINIRELMLPVSYVYKAMKLPSVLTQLRESRQQIAIVTDEYGCTAGLVSIEDVLEELVGEIWDETDTIEPDIIERPDGQFDVDGDMTLTEFAEHMGISEDQMDYESDTVGGWCIEMLGEFPEEGDSFEWKNLTVTVTGISERRVRSVRVEKGKSFS